jgi:hypothetical protein
MMARIRRPFVEDILDFSSDEADRTSKAISLTSRSMDVIGGSQDSRSLSVPMDLTSKEDRKINRSDSAGFQDDFDMDVDSDQTSDAFEDLSQSNEAPRADGSDRNADGNERGDGEEPGMLVVDDQGSDEVETDDEILLTE